MPLTSVQDVVDMLRWGDAEKAKYDTQLALYVAAASQTVEDEAGPFAEREVTHVADGAPSIVLPFRVSEMVDVRYVAPGGLVLEDGYIVISESSTTASGWTVDKAAGILRGPFPSGYQNVTVRFKVGSATIPEAVKLATTMVAADMWAIASQRAPALDDGAVDPAYLMPKVVRRLLDPFKAKQMPGFA